MSISEIARRCMKPVLNMKIIKISDNLSVSKNKAMFLTKSSKIVLFRINQSYLLGFSVPVKYLSFLPLCNVSCIDARGDTKAKNPRFTGIIAPILPSNSLWYAKAESGKGGPVRQSGGRIGRLDATNEAGLFHKVSRARLEELKKKLTEMKQVIKDEETTNPEKKQ